MALENLLVQNANTQIHAFIQVRVDVDEFFFTVAFVAIACA